MSLFHLLVGLFALGQAIGILMGIIAVVAMVAYVIWVEAKRAITGR